MKIGAAPGLLIDANHRSENPLRRDSVDSPIRFQAGRLYLPQTSGLGIGLRREKIERFRI